MEQLLKDIGVREKLMKPARKEKEFNKVKDNIPAVEDYNFMADLLHLPTAKYGWKYLLTMVDLANDEMDIEPLRSKTAEAVLNATKKIFDRGILKMPEASIRTDSGTEFKSVYAQFLHDNNIMHKISLPDRHKQTGNVERLNRELSRLIMGYLTTKDMDNGRNNKDWSHLVPIIRTRLNEIRKKKLPKNWKTKSYPVHDPTEFIDKKKVKTKSGKLKWKETYKMVKPKYRVGDKVHHVLNRPQNAKDKKEIGTWRMGDLRWSQKKKKIVQVLMYPGTTVRYRYLLEGITQASFSGAELKK